MRCGLLGKKLSHSYSPQIHSELGSYCYQLFEVMPEDLETFLKNDSFTGINVTIPYKKAVIQYCDLLSERAKQLGAVNTIVRKPDGMLIGHNTDYFGFRHMLQNSGLNVAGKKSLVLGSGGASVTAVSVLEELGAQVIVISRSGENNYNNLHKHYDASLIVNATPVGMFPETSCSPIDLACFTNLEGVLDLIYNPAHTKLLQQAEKMGIIAVNGLEMLVAQAKESAEWFLQQEIDNSVISRIHKKMQQQMENLVLIGMPGCGKSTIGALLANKLGKRFIDADTQIEMHAGKSIPDIFASVGEKGFRQIETEVLSSLGKQSGIIIATGGGCVTQQENYAHLHQNGKIVWIKRDISMLPTDGRPLSQQNSLADMYKIRKPMYQTFSDISVNNNSSVEDTVNHILTALRWEEK